MDIKNYKTILVRFQQNVCFIQLNRVEANNTINELLIRECHHVLSLCEESASVVVLEGLPETFCLGADFNELNDFSARENMTEYSAEPLYQLWLKLATGPFITISHVKGKTNAGGMGFLAASDIVLANNNVQFSLSEMLFGLFPACVLPFLIRKIGFQKAHYLTIMTKPITVQDAYAWGLVDAYDASSDTLLRLHLLRIKNLSKKTITDYKRYVNTLSDSLFKSQSLATETNKKIFSDKSNLEKISRYVENGKFPWEQ